MRLEDGDALVFREIKECPTLLVDQHGDGGDDGLRFGRRTNKGAVEPPTRRESLRVPQVALGAGDACRPLGATASPGQTGRLRSDTSDGGPLEGPAAATPGGPVLLAKDRLGQLDTALEGLAIGMLATRKVAQLQLVSPLQPILLPGVLLDQDAEGTRVADVQHHVDIEGYVQVVAAIADKLYFRD